MDIIAVLVDAIISVSMVLLAVLSLLKKGYRNSINYFFALFSFFLAVFIVSGDISNNINIPENSALIANYICFLTGYGSALLLLLFTTRLAEVKKINKLVKFIFLPLMIMGAIGATPLVVAGVALQGNIYAVNYGPLIGVYAFGLAVVVALLTYSLIYGLRHTYGEKRHQLAITATGIALSVPLVLIFALVIPLATGKFAYNSLSTTPAMILTLCIFYAIGRYHLFDIRNAAVRTLAYVLSLMFLLSVLFVILVALLAIFHNSVDSYVLYGLVFVVPLFISPVKKVFDRWTSQIFYRDYYNSDEFVLRINRVMTSTTDLRKLLEKVSEELARTLRSRQVFFFIHTDTGHHITAGTPSHTRLSKEEEIHIMSLIIGHSKEILLTSSLDFDSHVYKILASHKIEVAVPLYNDGIRGCVFLGERMASHYTSRDIRVLNLIIDSLLIAIQNTISIESIRESNSQLRQIDKVKDEFVSIASHELRTPMTVIRGFVSLLQREQLGDLNDKQQDILTKISDNTKALIDLVSDMLDISKLEANKLDIRISDFELADIINSSLEKIRLMFDKKGIKSSYKGDSVVIKTDAERFERIMLNLLSNAYKFTDVGGSVTITSTIDESAAMATICVADTGIGIPENAMDGLFKKFSQINNYLQRQSGGTGLGLA
ncbi:hypothetical protein HGB24_03465, partial [Candidatus Saccharibacteria bacterium]|nr:hypothetical protein [Candidatus Saccharibacteria bacterium]